MWYLLSRMKTFIKNIGIAGLCVGSTLSAKNLVIEEPEAKAAEKAGKKEQKQEARTSEWYNKNWPTQQSMDGVREVIKGMYQFKNKDGLVVGELKIQKGKALEGVYFIQGAGDYRMIHKYEEGKPKLLAHFYLHKGKWVDFDKFFRN